MKKNVQLQLPFPERGGKGKGAGRTPAGDRAGVPHRKRKKMSRSEPVHVTLKRARGLPGMRTKEAMMVLRKAFAAGCSRPDFRLVHYSVQHDHLHLIVEAEGRPELARGMQGLAVRIARALNRLWGRKGTVFADRYHDHVLRKPKEVRNAIRYVLMNAKKHGMAVSKGLDPFSSAMWFAGWCEELVMKGLETLVRPVAEARTWLMTTRWKRYGLLKFTEAPR